MSVAFEALVVAALAYLIGSVPCGFLLGKANGVDIRKVGSGNIGATNVTRMLGRDWGAACFVLDFLKGLLPVVLLPRLFADGALLPVLAGAGTVVGHMFPLYLKFKGGKGVSTSVGVLLALAFWSVVVGVIIWVVVFYSTRYVSLASLAAALSMPVVALVLPGESGWTRLLLVVLAVLIVVRHRTNIVRLYQGTEHRFKGKGK